MSWFTWGYSFMKCLYWKSKTKQCSQQDPWKQMCIKNDEISSSLTARRLGREQVYHNIRNSPHNYHGQHNLKNDIIKLSIEKQKKKSCNSNLSFTLSIVCFVYFLANELQWREVERQSVTICKNKKKNYRDICSGLFTCSGSLICHYFNLTLT